MINRQQYEIDAERLEQIGTPETDAEIQHALRTISNIDLEKAQRLRKEFCDALYYTAKDIAQTKREILKATE